MRNPLGLAKNTRKVYNKQMRKTIIEVEVDIEGAPKTWIPLDLLIALVNLNQNDRKTKTYSGTDAD
jgi:hypothetical protein